LPRFRDIRDIVRRNPLFPYPTPMPASILGCPPWSRSVMSEFADNEHPG